VWLPASRKSYTFPPLVAGSGKQVLDAGSTYLVELESFALGGLNNTMDLWKRSAASSDKTYRQEVRNTTQAGYVTLE
jgi:hypothetical protein